MTSFQQKILAELTVAQLELGGRFRGPLNIHCRIESSINGHLILAYIDFQSQHSEVDGIVRTIADRNGIVLVQSTHRPWSRLYMLAATILENSH